MNFEEILKQWGFESYVEKFKDQEINEESFKLLDEETIKDIFTKKGPYLLFKAKYKEYRESQNEMIIYNDLETISNASTISTDISNVTINNESSLDISNSANLLVITPNEEELEDLLNNFSNDENSSSDANFLIPEFPPPKKLKVQTSVFSKYKTLEELLLKSGAEGLSILAKKRKLSPDLRQKLVNIVVGELCGDLISKGGNVELKPIVFSSVAKEICSFFPGESEDVYFVPYVSGKGGLRRVPARGKLWSRYLTIKAQLRLLNKEKKISENPCEPADTTNPDSEKDLEFLMENDVPFPKILELWENTFPERKKILLKKDDPADYIRSFKCLLVDNGLLLLEADFNKKYPEKIDIVYKNLPKVAEAILSELTERGVHLGEYSEFDTTSQALLQLTFMFSTINIRKNRENWRPSRAEVKDSFFLKLNQLSDLSGIIERRKQKLDKLNFPLQPFGYIFNEEYFVYLYEKSYKVDVPSACRCLEILFKIYYVLDLEYPAESRHIWQFVQEIVFEFNATSKTSSTASALADVRYHLNSTS